METAISLDPPLQPARRTGWRQALATGLYHSGVLGLAGRASGGWDFERENKFSLRRATRPKLGILCYHRIGTSGLPLYSALPPAVFEAQMSYIRKRYRIVSVAELCAEMTKPASVKAALAVTFDDGYADLAEYALPILKKYRIPATIFLAVDAIESGEVPWYDRIFAILQVLPGQTLEIELDVPRRFALGSPADRLEVAQEIMRCLRKLPEDQRKRCSADLECRVSLPASAVRGRMLTWDQIRALQRDGITFGSHTMSHRVVGRLRPEEAQHELRESKRVIEEQLKQPADTFAFPFGQPSDIGEVSPQMLSDCGYRCAMTTVEGVNDSKSNPYRLCRTQIGEEQFLPAFAWKLNAIFLGGARRYPLSMSPQSAAVSKEGVAVEVGHA